MNKLTPPIILGCQKRFSHVTIPDCNKTSVWPCETTSWAEGGGGVALGDF